MELLQTEFPKDNWIQCESLRTSLFVSHVGDNEFYLKELEEMKEILENDKKPRLYSRVN